MTAAVSRDEAPGLADNMPGSATWDDPMHGIYVRQVIEKGIPAGRTTDVRWVRAGHGLPERTCTGRNRPGPIARLTRRGS